MSLSRCCRLFGISRQAIYQRQARFERRSQELSVIKPLVQSIRMRMPRIGTRKLYYLLKREFVKREIKIGRDALFDYLRSESMLIRPKKTIPKPIKNENMMVVNDNRNDKNKRSPTTSETGRLYSKE